MRLCMFWNFLKVGEREEAKAKSCYINKRFGCYLLDMVCLNVMF